MTIASEVTQLESNLSDSYTACQNKGATMPADQNFDNLATCIGSIPSGGGGTLITKNITVNGTYNASSDNADGYSSVTVNVSGASPQTAISIVGGQLVFNKDWIEDITGYTQTSDLSVSPGGTVQGNNVIIQGSAWGSPGTFNAYLIIMQADANRYTLGLDTSSQSKPLAIVECSSSYGAIDSFTSVTVKRPSGYWATS